MKYKNIYQKIMEKALENADAEMEKIKKDANPNKMTEWAVVYGALTHLEDHPRVAYREIEQTFAGRYLYSYDQYIKGLRKLNLDSTGRRIGAMSKVEEAASTLKRALDGDKAAAESFMDFMKEFHRRGRINGKQIFLGRCIITYLILLDSDLQNETYRPIVYSYGEVYCEKLLRRFASKLGEVYQLASRRRSAKDVLQQTEKTVKECNQANTSEAKDSDNELDYLRFMNQTYRNSLELVQSMLDELNEVIEESAEDAKNNSIATFYTSMNSAEYGNLLDSMALVERRLCLLKEQKVKIPPQLLPLTIVFKQLISFIKDSGITPIDEVGRTWTAEVEELASYTYIGEPYMKTGEKKNVVVERSGWKFEDTIISLPTVREVEVEELLA